MIILEDKGQKEEKHIAKNKYFERSGIEVLRYPLPVGDYIAVNEKVMDVINRKLKRNIAPKKNDFMGTYDLSVDTKENMDEICGNICGKQHGRFRDECILARNNNIKLIILVENEDGIKCLADVAKWKNPRMHRYNKINYMHRIGKWQNIKVSKKPPVDGVQLMKAMYTMQKEYGVTFMFCSPEDAGAVVAGLLGGGVSG